MVLPQGFVNSILHLLIFIYFLQEKVRTEKKESRHIASSNKYLYNKNYSMFDINTL